LAPVLAMSVAAMLAGCKSATAIHEWARAQSRSLMRRFGIRSYTTPSWSTLLRIYAGVDTKGFESLLATWVEGLLGLHGDGFRAISIDGKTLRGSQRKHAEVPGVHLIAAYLQQPGCVLSQMRVQDKTNEPKAALELIESLIMKNAVIVGDAIYCQRDLSETVLRKGGDYFWVAKDNQASLKLAIAGAFEAPISPPGETALAS
jgi:hypothetical protein